MLVGFRNRVAFILVLPLLGADATVSFSRHPGRIEISLGGKPFSNLYYGPEWPQPFLHPLRSADGVAITRGDTEEGALGIRFRDEFREDRGAVIINSDGLSGTKQVWGKRAAWVDYSTTVEGRTLGATIFDHPANPKYPAYWHARNYGLCAANPFGEHDFLKDKTRDGSLTVPAGETAVFRYRVAIHPGAFDPQAAARLASDFAKEK